MNIAANKALLQGAQYGQMEYVKAVLAEGADINYYSDCDGKTALKTAAIYGHFEIVIHLMECKANPYLLYNSKSLPEVVLEENGREDIAEYLSSQMKSQTILNRIDKGGYTPLGICIRQKYLHDKAKELITLGADVCKMDNHKKRPIVYAVEANSLEMVKILLENGADVSCVSALERALDLSFNEIAQILIEAKPEIVNANLGNASTPLIKSVTKRNVKMTKFLIEKGADPHRKDGNGNSALGKALEMESIETAEFLRSKMPNLQLAMEITPEFRYKFAENGNIEVFKFLLKNDWDIEQTYDNITSLGWSANLRNLTLAKFLIENGANLKAAKKEIENFTRNDIDFGNFMVNYLLKNKVQGKGQE